MSGGRTHGNALRGEGVDFENDAGDRCPCTHPNATDDDGASWTWCPDCGLAVEGGDE